MCFYITKEGLKEIEKIKERKEPIVAYKLLSSNYRSPYYLEKVWKIGDKIVSDRKGTKLTKKEKEWKEIDKGLHFYRNKPKKCPHRCPCPCRRPYRYPYLCPQSLNHWMKVSINPRSLVAINNKEIVATRCEVIEEIK